MKLVFENDEMAGKKSVRFKILIFSLLMFLMQGLSAQVKGKVLRLSGSMSLEALKTHVDSAVKKNSDLYILDFSKVICADWQGDAGFYFESENDRIQGVILPDAVKYFSCCVCPDLKFVQLSSCVTGFPYASFCSDTLRYIFITDGGSDVERAEEATFRHFNSAKIMHEDCFEFAREKGMSLFRLNPACREKDFSLCIPPEEVEVSTKVSYDCSLYSIFTTTENSDRRSFEVSWLELKEKKYRSFC